jgi:hypothetical protein
VDFRVTTWMRRQEGGGWLALRPAGVARQSHRVDAQSQDCWNPAAHDPCGWKEIKAFSSEASKSEPRAAGDPDGRRVARTHARATTTTRVDIQLKGASLIVNNSRWGADGYSVISKVIGPDGVDLVVHTAYDATGQLVHFHKSFPFD